MYASEIVTIFPEYCVQDSKIKASLFGYQRDEDAFIASFPKERMNFSLPTQQILDFFHDKNVTIHDQSSGIVTFKKECDFMGKKDILEKALIEKFHEIYPMIVLDTQPIISLKSPLPKDFEQYVLESITLHESALKRQNGTFLATFLAHNKRKKMTFYYEIHAKLPSFKAKRNLQTGKIVTNDDFESVVIEIDALPSKAIIGGVLPENLMVKNYIKEGQIASEYFFDIKKDVMKKETIKAFLTQDNLVIEADVIAQEDGHIGDIIKVKTHNGKVLNAKILSSKEAMIIE